MCVYLYVYIYIYFNLNAQLKKLISFTFVLFYETIEYVDNALCTVLVAPSVLENMTPPCELLTSPGVCLGKYDTHVNLWHPLGVD